MLLAMNEYHECCSAKYAEKEKTYYCRSCRKRVVLKRGKKNVLILPIEKPTTVRFLVRGNQKNTCS